ncbi:MAG: tryptophan synthase subunit alpha [Actinobacteria bacterium]|nr:tryptophan synthase subunit alpha [Actinomycetota bacterium]
MTDLRAHLEAATRSGRKLLVPYVMGGIPDRVGFPSVVEAVSEYADAVEVGLPFSDPLMDGPVIAAAGERAIAGGVGPLDVLDLLARTATPLLAMTYYNPIHSVGEGDFCARAVAAGISGLIVPDLPVEESTRLRALAADHGLAWIPLVAPTSSSQRIEAIAATGTGFVYAVSTMGVTGVRESLSERAAAVVERCRAATDLPVLVGIGVSSAEHAVAACRSADGVVIGSAVVARVMDEGAGSASEFLKGVRSALDRLP